MRTGLALIIVGLFGCSPTGPEKPAVSPTQPQDEPQGTAAPDPEPEHEPEARDIEVLMTAATLADDCGGGPTTRPQAPQAGSRAKRSAKGSRMRMESRACEQSSIQLAVTASQGAAPADIVVKSVELLLASGDSVGTLQTRTPSVWSDEDGYKPWDEKVEPGQDLSVSYAMTRPDWSKVKDRWNQTYTVKAVVSIAGTDQTVQHDVTVEAPTALPPNVRT